MIKKLSLLCTLISGMGIAQAAEYVWCGNGNDNNWITSTNWVINNGYYPQSEGDTAIIGDNVGEIIWSSGPYIGHVASIQLGAGNSLYMDGGSGSVSIKAHTITLGANSKIIVTGTNAAGYDAASLTINYGTFTAETCGLFDINMTGGSLWTNGKTITLTGTFDTTGLTGSGKVILYDASESSYSHAGGNPTYDVSGIVLNTTENITAEISAEGNQIAINYVVTPSVPEPATATLSLLVLCGLAARRRRK